MTRGRTLSLLAVPLMVALLAACGRDSRRERRVDAGPGTDAGPGADGGAGTDAGPVADGGGTDAGSGSCSGCTDAEGCVVVGVKRASEPSSTPWELWPDMSDGRGTLIVSAYTWMTDREVFARVEVEDADFTGTASYEIDLGCVPSGEVTLGAFLDDDLDAAADAVSSSDYPDFCMADRQPTTVVTAGASRRVDLELANSCD